MENIKLETKVQSIEEDWPHKKKKFFELENLIRRCEAVEEFLILALKENRNIMFEINEERIAYLPTALEPEDYIQHKIIKLRGITQKEIEDWEY